MSWQTMIESDDKTEPESQRSIPAIKYVPFQLHRMQKGSSQKRKSTKSVLSKFAFHSIFAEK